MQGFKKTVVLGSMVIVNYEGTWLRNTPRLLISPSYLQANL